MWNYNSSELYHFGVLGMKWGVRKSQNNHETTVSYRKLKKQIARSSPGKNVSAVTSRYNAELSKTKEARAAKRASDNLVELNKQFKKEHPDGTLVFGENFKLAYNKILDDYAKKGKEIFAKYEDQLASATLKDLGYEDTGQGREQVKKIMAKEFH